MDHATSDLAVRALFHASSQPIVLVRPVFGPDGAVDDLEVVDLNRPGARAIGATAEQAAGMRLNERGFVHADRYLAAVDAAMATHTAVTFEVDEAPDGRLYRAEAVRLAPDLVALLGLDVTDERQAVDALREVERQRTREVEEARQVARMGAWRHDPASQTTTWSPEMFRIFGLDPADGDPTPETVDSLMEAETVAARARAVAQSAATGQPWQIEYPIRRPDGETRWVLTRGVAEADAGGTIHSIQGIALDITEPKEVELRLRASEEELRQRTADLEEARRVARLGTWRRDAMTGRMTWSPELYEITGLDPAGPAPSATEYERLMDAEALQRRAELLRLSATTGDAWQHEYAIHRADGTTRWLLSCGVAETAADGTIIAAHGTALDITERKRAEFALRASEERLRHRTDELEEAREIARLGVWRRHIPSGATIWSPEMFRIFGLDPADGTPDADELNALVGPETTGRLATLMADAARTGETWEDELLLTRPDGEERWMLHRGVVETDMDGVAIEVHGTALDITERKRAELALRASEEALRRRTAELEEARRIAGIGVWRVDARTGATTWSQELLALAGLDPDGPPLTVAYLDTFLDAATIAERDRLTMRSILTGEPWQQEYPFHRADGDLRWVLVHGVAERGPDGTPVAFGGTAMDITERKVAELALAASEERFRTVLDGLVEGAEIIDRDWRLVYINRGFTRLDGPDPTQEIGRSLMEVLPGFEGSEIYRHFKRCMDERITDRFEGMFQRPGAAPEWFEFSVQPVPEGIFVLGLEITERHRAEVAIRERALHLGERAADLEQAQDIAGLGMWRRDLRTRTTVWSPEMYEIFGLDPLAGPPDPAVLDALLSPETRAMRDHAAAAGAASGVPWEVELEVTQPGTSVRWVLQHGTVVRDADGTISAYLGTASDITERKQIEQDLRRFNEALEQRVLERTAALEAANEDLRSFSYTVSHDLRAPVRAVAGFAGILERDHGAELDAHARHSLENIRIAGEAMGRLIDDLLAYTRLGRSAVRREPVLMEPIARRLAATFADRVTRPGGALQIRGPLATPMGDPTLVEEILINLVDNALTYARPGVPPLVTIGADRVDGHVRISVMDNGQGIPREAHERIFEVFTRLSTPDGAGGTGIGLAIVRKAARHMGSDITVDSEVGEGSTFSLALPAAEPTTDVASDAGQALA